MPHVYLEKKKKRFVTLPLILEFRTRVNNALLHTGKYPLRICIDRQWRTLLNWGIKDHGIPHEETLLRYLKETLENEDLLKQFQKDYPDLPPFYVVLGGLYHTITWEE